MPALHARAAAVSLLLLVAASGRPARAAAGTADARPTASGTLRDPSGAPVGGAEVLLLDVNQVLAASARSDADGAFTLAAPAPGRYSLLVRARGLAERRERIDLGAGDAPPIALELAVPPFASTVSITAHPGASEEAREIPQAVNVIGREELALRAKTVVAQAVEREPGLHLQRTSPTMAGIFVRGLTGNKVNVFVDGARFSTGAARGGVNTFLDLNDPATVDTMEVLRGPSSTQFGSDAIGGSVQLLSRPLAFSAEGERLTGSIESHFATGDHGLGGEVEATWSSPTFALEGTAYGRRAGDLRAGEETDSHNAVTRFLGLDPEIVLDDDRLPDTGFHQFGGALRGSWAASPRSRLSFSYRRGQQEDGSRYDQLIGGDGNLIADLDHLTLDLAQVEYERWSLGAFDRLSLAYSFNTQREERVNQGGNGNPAASINHEPERTTVHGLRGSLARRAGPHELTFGADFYAEEVDAPSYSQDPATGATSVRRGRVPDGASFHHGGIYLHDEWKVKDGLSLVGSVRWNAASYEARAADSPLVNGAALWPDDELSVDRVTFRAGASWRPQPSLTIAGSVASGFRAPHITDLGTLGLTGAGFEVSSADVAGLGATVGSTADRNAVSSGQAVEEQRPEKSLAVEASLRWHAARIETELSAFVNDIDENITKQALILPPGAVGLLLGDQVITAQDPGGAVFVAAASNPVLVRSNFDDARIWGIEHALRVALAEEWRLSTAFTYLHAADRRTGRPPNIEGGTPAPEAWLAVRWAPSGRRWWVEPYSRLVAENDRLSTLDLEDRRTGATRSRNSIASFFRNGARARGLIGPGADGLENTTDDVLLATGETLEQVQDRVLGPGVGSAPLYDVIDGFALFGVRGGWKLGRHEVLVELENLGDRNYRGVSWGVDGNGRSLYLRYRLSL